MGTTVVPSAGGAARVAVGAGLGPLELSWIADVLGLRDAAQPALLVGTSREVKATHGSRLESRTR